MIQVVILRVKINRKKKKFLSNVRRINSRLDCTKFVYILYFQIRFFRK